MKDELIKKLKDEYKTIKGYFCKNYNALDDVDWDKDYMFYGVAQAYEVAHRLEYEIIDMDNGDVSEFVKTHTNPIREIVEYLDNKGENMTAFNSDDMDYMVNRLDEI